MRKQKPRRHTLSDHDTAIDIVSVLFPDLVTESGTLNFVEDTIKKLRAHVQRQLAEPSPGDMSKLIAQFAEAARTLSGIEKVPYLRSQLSFYLEAGHSDGRTNAGKVTVLPGHRHEMPRMSEWITNLKTFAHMLEFWRDLNAHHRQDPKLSCAVWAHDLIDRLSPTTKLPKTEDSPFYEITALLWGAVSRQQESMKRVCDDYIDHVLRGKKPDIKGTTILRITIPSA